MSKFRLETRYDGVQRETCDGDWGVQFITQPAIRGYRPRRWELWINQPNAKKTRRLSLGRMMFVWQPAVGYNRPVQ
jgi:hypothetical protein